MADEPIEFPARLAFLFEPHRYKVAYGGRGSAKSWTYARALLAKGAQQKLRIICAREVQKSIKQSVHTLLSDQVQALGLGGFYEVLETEIRGKNGTTFSFTGLGTHTVESIKSFEGADICWVEEAQTVSKRSWGILIPTIRAENSEIWVSFNPDLDTDDTYIRFVVEPPESVVSAMVNYIDNPWFPSVLEQERIHAERTMPADEYANVWEGRCRTTIQGAIYAAEVDAAIRDSRFCNVPYDPKLKVHTIWDLGWNDSMVIGLVQKLRSEIRIVGYIEDSHRTLDWYVAELQKMNMNWGTDYLPHDGKHADFKTGMSAQQILADFGRRVEIVPDIGLENGIKAARMALPRCYIDKTKGARLINCLKRYRRSVNQQTNEPGAPVHDEFSHGADMFRYLSIVADQLNNDAAVKQIATTPKIKAGTSGASWMGG